jgi:hypothetical protein
VRCRPGPWRAEPRTGRPGAAGRALDTVVAVGEAFPALELVEALLPGGELLGRQDRAGQAHPVLQRLGEGVALCGGVRVALLGSGRVRLLGLDLQDHPVDPAREVCRDEVGAVGQHAGLDRSGDVGRAVAGAVEQHRLLVDEQVTALEHGQRAGERLVHPLRLPLPARRGELADQPGAGHLQLDELRRPVPCSSRLRVELLDEPQLPSPGLRLLAEQRRDLVEGRAVGRVRVTRLLARRFERP